MIVIKSETDKERILTKILEGIARSCVNMPYAKYYENKSDFHGTYLGWFEGDASIKVGDLVMCNTIRDTQYKFGFVTKIHSDWHMDIKEIGSDNVCSISNESFYPIRGMSKRDLLDGKEYQMYEKILKAFRKGDEYMYLFNGIDFKPDNIAVVSIRKKWSGAIGELETFDVEIKYDSKTSIKSILESLQEQGYGTKFERK